MAIGTPANTLAGALVNAATHALAIPVVAAGNILLITSHARRNSTTLAPNDPTLSDTSTVPLVWTPVFSTPPVQVGVSPGTKAQWWWAISDGAAKSVTLSWGSAGTIFSSVGSFTIGASMAPNFVNQTWGGAVGAVITVNLPSSPTTGINFLSFYGGGGSASTIASGFTSLTNVGSTPYRTGYDLTPVTSTTMGNASFPDSLLLVANIVEVSAGAYTLPAVAGSYALTGATASLEKSRFITADAGAYALTGADATLTKGVAVTIFVGLTAGVTDGVIGSGGSLPTGWGYSKTSNVTLTVVSHGGDDSVECFDLKIDATTAATSTCSIFWPNGFGGMASSPGKRWKTGAYLKRMAVSGSGIDGNALSIHEANAGGGYILGHDNYAAIPSAGAYQASYREITATLSDPAVAKTDGGLYISQNAVSAPSSVTIRIAAKLEESRLVTAVAGSYALTGAAANLEIGREVGAVAGSYALTGASADAGGIVATYLGTTNGDIWPGTVINASFDIGAADATKQIVGVLFLHDNGCHPVSGTFAGVSATIEVDQFATGGDRNTAILRAAVGSASGSQTLSITTTPYVGGHVVDWYSVTAASTTLVDSDGENKSTWPVSVTIDGAAGGVVLAGFNAGTDNYSFTGDYDFEHSETGIFGMKTTSGYDATGSGSISVVADTATLNIHTLAAISLEPAAGAGGTNLEYGREITAVSGAYTLTGIPVNLLTTGARAIIGLPGAYALTGQPATLSKTSAVAYSMVGSSGAYALTGQPVTLIWSGEIVVTPPGGGGMPWYGRPSGGKIPTKQLRKAIRELIARQERRKKPKKAKELAKELIASIKPQGLGVAEKRLVTGLLAEGLQELWPIYFASETIHDKGDIARAILFVLERAIQRLADEEEDEEAALLLLSA